MSSEVAATVRDVFDVLFVVVREDDRVMLDVVGSRSRPRYIMNVEHENFRLRRFDGLWRRRFFSIEEGGHGVTKVGIDYDIVAMRPFHRLPVQCRWHVGHRQERG